MTLVNKDQLDILASLRESVNEDKIGLEADVERLKKTNKELSEKNRMQLEQVNALLLEKVNLQSEGIGHREKMLQRERDFGYELGITHSRTSRTILTDWATCSDLRVTLAGKDVPEDIKQRLLAMHEDNLNLKLANKDITEKLTKARQVSFWLALNLNVRNQLDCAQFVKQQDKRYREDEAARAALVSVCRHAVQITLTPVIYANG